jgi:DNA-binding transcriptional LysR family regulator
MLDGVSLDQLRTFIAAADEGSFSAAGRRLKRAQSVVSQTLANLEGQLRVKLFDRRGRLPILTEQGRALLTDARVVAGDVDLLKARAKTLAGGLESELSVAVDVMFPPTPFTASVAALHDKFPSTMLRVEVESTAVVDSVLDGRCKVGMMGSWARVPPALTRQPLLTLRVPLVVSPQHPLATHRGPIPSALLAEHVQLVHVDPADVAPGQRSGVRSAKLWRLSQLETKLAFLRAGFGYGALPLHLIEADLAAGALVEITPEGAPPDGYMLSMSTIYRTDSPPGPVGSWFIERLKQEVTAGEKFHPDRPTEDRLPNISDRPIVLCSREKRHDSVGGNSRRVTGNSARAHAD